VTVLLGYFDESCEMGDGFVVVAGFVGRIADWKKYLKLWHQEMGDVQSLHLKEMRLGSSAGFRRYGDLLRRLGSVPYQAGLHAFAGSVRTAPYASRIKGTIAAIGLAGYNVALAAMLDAILESRMLPKREKIDFIFEEQTVFTVHRAATIHGFRHAERYRTCQGKSRIGRDSAMGKGPLLEASDYLAYAILQQLVNSDSERARATAPILEASKPMCHTEVTKENVDDLLAQVYGEHGQEIPAMDRDKRAFILQKLKNSVTR
jgi:hypothetical protein